MTDVRRPRLPFALGALVCAGALAVALEWPARPDAGARTPAATTKPAVAGSEGTFYIGTYAGNIEIIDEATEKVIGADRAQDRHPRRLTPSDDRTRFYVADATQEKIEIVDRVKRETLDTFTLSEDRTKVRIWDLQPDPLDKFLILLYRNYTLMNDRWEIGR